MYVLDFVHNERTLWKTNTKTYPFSKLLLLEKFFANFPGILQNAKTNPGMKLFRDNRVTLNYYYSDKNGEYVTEYIVKPEMYEE